MDIRSGKKYPANALSNFAPHKFIFDGVECASMEGLLQALKFENPWIQEEVCSLVGRAAKQRGSGRNKYWQAQQILWWKGVAYDRHGDSYQELLDRAFNALATNESFRRALIATQDAIITHSIGKRKKSETVLTKQEFCSRLMKLREQINAKTI